MKLEKIVSFLEQRLVDTLPAIAAHELLRAKPIIGNKLPTFSHKNPPKLGGVLILLYENNGTIKFPLIKRPTYPGAHSGQISLPGGKTEHGEDIFQTAIREAEEEIGINRNEVRVIGRLTDFNVIPSNFLITPVIGVIDYIPVFVPDKHEVDKIIFGDMADLIKPDAIQEKEILAAGVYPMVAPHFLIEDEIVWGATAMMLNELRTLVMEMK
jgi:8-oxo-dGTP pyrophosphatase MutT (NUDIX family)